MQKTGISGVFRGSMCPQEQELGSSEGVRVPLENLCAPLGEIAIIPLIQLCRKTKSRTRLRIAADGLHL
jgi:hypothetical protein